MGCSIQGNRRDKETTYVSSIGDERKKMILRLHNKIKKARNQLTKLTTILEVRSMLELSECVDEQRVDP